MTTIIFAIYSDGIVRKLTWSKVYGIGKDVRSQGELQRNNILKNKSS